MILLNNSTTAEAVRADLFKLSNNSPKVIPFHPLCNLKIYIKVQKCINVNIRKEDLMFYAVKEISTFCKQIIRRANSKETINESYNLNVT